VGRIARRLGVEVRYEPLDGDLSGMLLSEEDRAIIGVNALHLKSRQRLTIAHELGRLALHERERYTLTASSRYCVGETSSPRRPPTLRGSRRTASQPSY